MTSTSAQVSVEWLKDNLEKVKVLDGTWFPTPQKDAKKIFSETRIPGAHFFDVLEVADRSNKLAYILPSAEQFEKQVSEMGISSDDTVVVYETGGSYLASARVWWTFRVFSHDKVYVLQGGLNEWLAKKFPTESGPVSPVNQKGNFKATLRQDLIIYHDKVQENSVTNNQHFLLLDARPEGRFSGRDPEPVPGIRSGHIEGSVSVPFTVVMRPTSLSTPERPICHLLSKDELTSLFEKKNVPLSNHLATSCGSGLTGPVVGLALYELGLQNVPHYGGSWTEWATLHP